MSIDFFQGNKRILVTGGAGFIGGCLIRRLLKESNALIFNIDKLSYASDLSGIKAIDVSKNRHFHLKVDLSNQNETNQAIKAANPDLVIHLAAESHVDRSLDSPVDFIQSNIIGTYNLLEAVREHWNKLTTTRKENFRFHHVSTDEVYGSLGETGYFNEKSNYNPRSPYSSTKASSDHLVNAWHHSYGLPTVTTNCSNNFGPFQFPEKLIPLTILKAIKTKEIPLYGDGSNVRDWLYVEDHVDALLLVAKDGKLGENYCIGGYGEKSNKDVVEIICSILDKYIPESKPHENLIKLVKDRPGHDRRYSIDSDKITKELGWVPKYTFQQGVLKTIKWYLYHQDWCKSVMEYSDYKGDRLGKNLKSINP